MSKNLPDIVVRLKVDKKVSHFSHNLSNFVWISFSLSKWRFSCSLNGHISPPPRPQFCSLHVLECFLYFWAWNPKCYEHVFFVTILGDTPNHILLNICFLIRKPFEQMLSTLSVPMQALCDRSSKLGTYIWVVKGKALVGNQTQICHVLQWYWPMCLNRNYYYMFSSKYIWEGLFDHLLIWNNLHCELFKLLYFNPNF